MVNINKVLSVMDSTELFNLISGRLIEKFNKSNGLKIYLYNRSKFENWLKLEICDILYEYFGDKIITEKRLGKNYIDIVFEDWALELKTFIVKDPEAHIRPNRNARGNIKKLLKQIDNYKVASNQVYKNKAVLFIVYPYKTNNGWDDCLKAIEYKLGNKCNIKVYEFSSIKQNISPITIAIYFGIINPTVNTL